MMKKTLFIIVSCLSSMGLANQTGTGQTPQSWVTVFIHGTQPNWLIPHAVNICYCPEGITKTTAITSNKHYYKNLMHTLAEQNPHIFDRDNMYLAGWSGALSLDTRRDMAKLYYQELVKIVEPYQQKHTCSPRIRLITHSHGGNIALHLAEFYQADHPIIIDELILLGCPVQKDTSSLTQHSMFKKIYAIYSPSDTTQVIDPQGMRDVSPRISTFFNNPTHDHAKNIFIEINRPFFSQRTFEDQDNIIHIQLIRDWIGIWHV